MSFLVKWFGWSPEKSCDEGLAALDRRDFAAAADAFRACVEGNSRQATIRIARFHLADCHTHLAEAAYREDDLERARDQIDVALAYALPTSERHLVAAQIARSRGDREEAAYHLDAALAKTPEHEQALALRALEWYEEGRTEEAFATADAIPEYDGRLRRFREAHGRGDRDAAAGHLLAVAAGYPESLL